MIGQVLEQNPLSFDLVPILISLQSSVTDLPQSETGMQPE